MNRPAPPEPPRGSPRTGECVRCVGGGLKLALEGAGHGDRRVRCAAVFVVAGEDKIWLVTDSHGRLRYPLPAGEYRVGWEEGSERPFVVADRRWTKVRLSPL
jgi:hypothetical protein